jgi:glycosyltransferase involved in cell wall biosynthesis
VIDVVHVTTGLDIGGAELLLHDLTTQSSRHEFNHRVVSLLPGGSIRTRLEGVGIDVVDVGMRHARPSLRAFFALRRVLRSEARDRVLIVHAWMYHACLASALALACMRQQGHRLLWGVHAANLNLSAYHFTTTLVTKACRWLSTVPDAIVVNSQTTEDYHRSLGYRPNRWVMIPNGIDTRSFRPDPRRRAAIRAALGIGQSSPLIGFIARRDPQKDHVTFLRAAARLHTRLPNAHFLLAGHGTEAHDPIMRDLVRSHAPHARLHLLGAREDVASVTASLDIATMCTFGESFSNVVVEAMASGVPCVVSRVPPLPDIVGDSGSVVDVADPEALAAAWESLLAESPEKHRARVVTGLQRSEGQFSSQLMVRRFEALYWELASAQRRPSTPSAF